MAIRESLLLGFFGALTLTPSSRLTASAVHDAAYVNDARSHGKLADDKLSLDEAIRVHNGSLALSKLSAAERAQITGTSDVTWIIIDPKVTPRITCERDLTTIIDRPHGLLIGPRSGVATIDLTTTRGFVVTSQFCDFKNLVLVGGSHGMQLTQQDPTWGTRLTNVAFERQTQTGLALTLPKDGGWTLVELTGCRFDSIPTAILAKDIGAKRAGSIEIEDTSIVGGSVGIDWQLGSGGRIQVELERVSVLGTDRALRFARSSSSDRVVDLLTRELEIRGGQHGISIAANAKAADRVDLVLSEIEASGEALGCGHASAGSQTKLSDCNVVGSIVVEGKLDVLGGKLEGRLTHTSGAASLQAVLLSKLDGQSKGQLSLEDCAIIATSLSGSGDMTTCSKLASRIDARLKAKRPRPSIHLAECSAIPPEPAPGATIQLDSAIPSGFAGLWTLAAMRDRALLVGTLRIYGEPSSLLPIGVAGPGWSRLSLHLPRDETLRGLDLAAQLFTLPTTTAQPPTLSSPPTQRLRIR